MFTMLPSPADGTPRLTDVFLSCLDSVLGRDSSLGLPNVRVAIVILVDGLGTAGIRARRGHARFLASRLEAHGSAATVFPATTAAALASLTTGAMPGEHGLVGYRVLDAAHDRLVNQLSGWDEKMPPDQWQLRETIFERALAAGITGYAIGARRYQNSGFSEAILRGSQYRIADRIEDRFDQVAQLAASGQRAICYLYLPELDIIAHRDGHESGAWTEVLEEVDHQVAVLEARLGADVGFILTGDHGVVDVPAAHHVLFDTIPGLTNDVRWIGGDPRCLYLYLEPGTSDAQRAAVLERWRESEGSRSWVLTRDEAIAAGLFGGVGSDVVPRIGEIIVAARERIAYYDSRTATASALSMVGQHGSLTAEETEIPLICGGAYQFAGRIGSIVNV